MITRSLQGKLLVLAVFLIGIATGILFTNLYHSRVVDAKPADKAPHEQLTPQERAKRDQDRLAAYLGLDQNQRDQIKAILDDTRAQFRQLREKTNPQFKAIEDGSRARILAVLSEDQRRKYEEFRKAHPGRGGRERSRSSESAEGDKK